MSLSSNDRAHLLSLIAELGPRGDRRIFTRAVQALGPGALDEYGAQPGHDQLRAALVRVLDTLIAEKDREAVLLSVEGALKAYPRHLQSDDPLLKVARHPAWVGMAALECDRQAGRDADLNRAVQLARLGFGQEQPSDRGEVLWAMAEQAEEAGWTDTATNLLSAALESPFHDEDGRGEVRLVYGLRLAEDSHPDATRILTEVATATGPLKRRIHARWVLAAMVKQTDPQGAIAHLSEALVMARQDDDTRIVQQIEGAMRGLGVPLPS